MRMIHRLSPRNVPTMVSESMVRRRVELAPCIESLPDKGGQAASPDEQCGLQRYKCRMKKASA
ncbi:hypothetical protein L195_g029529 [Trifolium pratense]|uniref:Uncharacterized protein n=1 Tax=Trifolium pratense TaxID=57577 RepID=A0A2K3L520_TRIPR|nr:hypothetical protein L195_g029529 [Trifolium pratense]